MLEKIKHINPKEITDLAELQDLMLVFMNILENQSITIIHQAEEIQALKNEVNRLKGEHGDLAPRAPKSENSKAEKPKKKS